LSAPAKCLQERYAPENRCYGCGPSNAKGLRIRSFAVSDDPRGEVVLDWTPAEHHQAYEGMVNGGIIGSILDCHCNWTAAWHLMRRDGLDAPPCTVTADYHVRMKRPTPAGKSLHVVARVTESEGSKVTVEAELSSDGTVTATCIGRFVAVKPGHPAYGRW
jgi:acyl-coenzyme A thioesterase PaaI-like protein